MQHQQIRRFGHLAIVTSLLAYAAACGGPEGRSHNPTAPSGAAPFAGSGSSTASEPTSVIPQPGGPPLPSEVSGPSAVNFPPRTEALLFRIALEAKYRDGLRRSSVLTFVDQEGTVVWVQEYLRYRVNLCSHVDAILRVFQQIDGFGVQPVCGVTNTAVFAPRQEPLDFMVQLEAKYRDGLRRSAGPTFVDIEGNVIWVQEYFRYRVSGCDHVTAQQKVFDQIDGRGVQPDCSGGGGGGNSGGSSEINDSVNAGSVLAYTITMPANGRYDATLTWGDSSVDLDLYFTTTGCNYPPASCLIAISNGSTGNSEHVSAQVQAGRQYQLWVDNFTNRAQGFRIVHFVAVGSTPPTDVAVAAESPVRKEATAGKTMAGKTKP